MNLKSKNVLFCGEITDYSKAMIKELLKHDVKSLLVSNTIEDSIDQLGLADSRLSHYGGNITRIEDLEAIYTEAVARTKKKVHLVVNHKELSANDAWENVITAHINSLICSTLMAIKHLGSMNAGGGGTVVNSFAISGRSDEEYASIHRLLSDLDRSFSDPYYFNNTAVRILTMCVRMEIKEGSDKVAQVYAETHLASTTSAEEVHPMREDVSGEQEKIGERLLDVCSSKRSTLDQPGGKHVEEFEISVRN